MSAPILSQAMAVELLDYDPATGTFTWRQRQNGSRAWNTRYAGREAGYLWSPTVGRPTYRVIRVHDWPFMAHRLAVLIVTGAMPKYDVDHRNGDGTDNRWSNLREATKLENGANRGPTKRNATGFKGVSLNRRSGRYRASIQVAGKWQWLGSFATAEDAHAAYVAACRSQCGDFARVS